MKDQLPNRWGIAVSAVIMQVCLGAVYGWSVFVKPLVAAEHWKLTDVSFTFTLAVVFLGVGTVIGGNWLDRAGPRSVASVAGVLYGIGYMVSGYAASHHSLHILYAGYGVLFPLKHGKDITFTQGPPITAFLNGDKPLTAANFPAAKESSGPAPSNSTASTPHPQN